MRSAAASRIASSGVTAGFVRYLCLEKTVLDILVACVFQLLISNICSVLGRSLGPTP